MSRRTNLETLRPAPRGITFGNRTYVSDKSYQEQMRKLTAKAVVSNAGLFPESEFTKPYAAESYQAMEYWFPWPFDFNLDWELLPLDEIQWMLDNPGVVPYVEIPVEEEETPAPTTESVWPTPVTGPEKWASGSVAKLGDATWATAHDAVTGDAFSNAACNFGILVDIGVPSYSITRGFLYFDLSALSGTILSAQIHGNWTATGSSTYSISEGTQVPPMGTLDFDSFNSTQFGSIVNPSGQQALDFNETGVTFLQGKLGSNAKICFRENTYDVADTDPAATVNKSINMSLGSSGESNVHLHITFQG